MIRKILFIDSTHPLLVQKLKDAGFIVELDYESSKEEVIAKISSFFGVIIRSRFTIDKTFIDHASQLKFIGRVGAGMESIDVDYAKSKGIACISSPEGNRNAVGEHALGLLLALSNNIVKANSEVKAGVWSREANRGFELEGKTIAIIGYGNTGSAFAQKLSGFHANVIAYDKYKTGFSSDIVTEVTEEKLFELADVVSFHVPYNQETHYYFNTNYINKYIKSLYLLNTSRGKVVCIEDLVTCLRTKKIVGAALDVLEYEDTSLNNAPKELWSEGMNFLSQAPNVILTPHIAGWTNESNVKLSTIIADKVIYLFNK